MQISTAFEFVRASSPAHAARPQNISFTYNAEGHAAHPHPHPILAHPGTSHSISEPILSRVLCADQRRTAVDRSCELHEVPPRAPPAPVPAPDPVVPPPKPNPTPLDPAPSEERWPVNQIVTRTTAIDFRGLRGQGSMAYHVCRITALLPLY